MDYGSNLLAGRIAESREVGYVRDVGVAGSNPVTPTIDFIIVFHRCWPTVPGILGSRFQKWFQFRRGKIARHCGCLRTLADKSLSEYRKWLFGGVELRRVNRGRLLSA